MSLNNSAGSCEDTVVLLHAAVVSHRSLFVLARRLKNRGFRIFNLDYPNRKLGVLDCADSLYPMFRDLSVVSARAGGRIHIVGHSMGGLVARHLLQMYQPPNFGRLVTLGTPHRGSRLADVLQDWFIYEKLFGPAGDDLVTNQRLNWVGPWPPPYEIGLIAGTVPIGPGLFLLRHPSDGTVARGSAQPPGGTDYATVRATHTLIPFLKKTADLTARFFRTGRFNGQAGSESRGQAPV